MLGRSETIPSGIFNPALEAYTMTPITGELFTADNIPSADLAKMPYGQNAGVSLGAKQWSATLQEAVFGDKQSVELAFGALEFRKSTKTVQIAGISAADTLEKVKTLGFLDALSVKEKLNTEAMENWTDEKLALIGRRRQQSESFRVNPHEEIRA